MFTLNFFPLYMALSIFLCHRFNISSVAVFSTHVSQAYITANLLNISSPSSLKSILISILFLKLQFSFIILAFTSLVFFCFFPQKSRTNIFKIHAYSHLIYLFPIFGFISKKKCSCFISLFLSKPSSFSFSNNVVSNESHECCNHCLYKK